MTWAQDFRFAFRMTGKKPWFSAAIVVTLALGMGINTTVFCLVNAALYKPLPFPGGDRLVMVSASNPSAGRDFVNVSYADFRDFRQARSFDRLEALDRLSVTLAERANPPELYRGARVSAGMFDMLGVRPVLGRGLLPSDEKPGAEPVILLGYGVWTDRYGRDPGVIGRTVRANQKPAVIAGVMPEGFKFPANEDLWMAAVPDTESERRSNRQFILIGMLKEGSSIAEAQADLGVVAKRLEQQFPDTHKDHQAAVRTFHEAMNGGRIRLVVLLMLGAVGFVLLIACANVANMLLSRAVERTREISIRAAMGASRWRLVRQLLIESVLLAAFGGALGLLLARFGIEAFGRAVENVGKPYWVDFSMDYLVFGYFAALVILGGIIFGIAPALSVSRADLNRNLKEGSRGSGGVRGGWLSGALVVFQFTLAVVLLSGAGLMIRSFLFAQDEFSAMRGEQVLTARVSLPSSRYEKPEDRRRFFETLMPRLAAIPGAQSASVASMPPGSGSFGWRFEIEGRLVADAQRRPAASGVVVWKDYLRVLGLSLIRGRDFEDSDGLPGKKTVIVTRQFASRFFADEDPLGKQIRLYDSENKPRPWMTIIGIAPDIRQNDPSDPSSDPLILVPYRFENSSSVAIFIRTQVNVSSLTSAVHREVQQRDQDLPLFEVQSLAELFRRQRWYLRVFGSLFAVFAVVAMGMATVGIYAVMAHATSLRTREIGVRVALGAGVRTILRIVMGRGLKQLVLGIVLGGAAALAVCRLMARLLFQVSPNDPITLVMVVVALGSAGLVATWFPARRAARLDPLKALREE